MYIYIYIHIVCARAYSYVCHSGHGHPGREVVYFFSNLRGGNINLSRVHVLPTTYYWFAAWNSNRQKGVSKLLDYLLLVCGFECKCTKRCAQTTGLAKERFQTCASRMNAYFSTYPNTYNTSQTYPTHVQSISKHIQSRWRKKYIIRAMIWMT